MRAKTVLICHHDAVLNREVLSRHMARWSDLLGIVLIEEEGSRLAHRVRFEWRRSGLRLFDVLAFRIFYRLRLAADDAAWTRRREAEGIAQLGDAPDVPVHTTADPNSDATRAFLEQLGPDMVLARCKTLLRREIFDVPALGTYVVHPGICPEYRNAHGCFWALARRDLDRVGATLLRIDEGVDTGPIYAYYDVPVDELAESHVVIQQRMVFDNLDALADDLARIHAGGADPIDVSGRPSRAWGQPRLTDYLRWKRAAHRDGGSGHVGSPRNDTRASLPRRGLAGLRRWHRLSRATGGALQARAGALRGAPRRDRRHRARRRALRAD